MDIALSMVAGLSLRAFFLSVNNPFGNLTPAILGLWEGIVLHHLSNQSSSEIDPYLAYGLRIAIDFLISRNSIRMAMIMLWTASGMVISESIRPRNSLKRSAKRDRRHRSSRSLPSHVRMYQHPVTPEPNSSPSPKLPFFPPKAELTTPQFPTNRPPSPPSFFLHEDSESLSQSPIPVQVHTVLLSPTRPPSALASYLDKGQDPGSPSPKPILLPTPPQSAPSDGMEYLNSREVSSPYRLSTIQEISSGGDLTPPKTDVNGHFVVSDEDKTGKNDTSNEYCGHNRYPESQSDPSSPTGSPPIPVPNATILSSFTPFISDNDEDKTSLERREYYASPMMSVMPTPVPNLTIPNWHSEHPTHRVLRGDHQDSAETSPTPNFDNFDQLMTPINDRAVAGDPLQTPITPRQQSFLSPLFLDVALVSGALVNVDPVPPILETVPPVATEVGRSPNLLIDSTLLRTPTVPGKLPLDYPPVDLGVLSDPETLLTPSDTTSVLSTRSPTQLTRKAERFRQEARVAEDERDKLRKEHETALKELRIKDALILKGKMWDMEEKTKVLHRRAAKRYYVSLNDYNPKRRPNTIDVHGLRPGEAIDKTEKALREALSAGQSSLRVIVGKGLHSVGRKAILKQAIMQAMTRQKIPCRVDTSNTGVLILTLPS